MLATVTKDYGHHNPIVSSDEKGDQENQTKRPLAGEREIKGINERVGNPDLPSAIRIKMASYDSRFIDRGETTAPFFASLSHYCTFD